MNPKAAQHTLWGLAIALTSGFASAAAVYFPTPKALESATDIGCGAQCREQLATPETPQPLIIPKSCTLVMPQPPGSAARYVEYNFAEKVATYYFNKNSETKDRAFRRLSPRDSLEADAVLDNLPVECGITYPLAALSSL